MRDAAQLWAESGDFPCLFEKPDDYTIAKRVIVEVCQLMRVTSEQLDSKRRTQHLAYARMLAMYATRELTTYSYPVIGILFDRDHSTVISGCQTIRKRMVAVPTFRRLVEGLLESVGPT